VKGEKSGEWVMAGGFEEGTVAVASWGGREEEEEEDLRGHWLAPFAVNGVLCRDLG